VSIAPGARIDGVALNEAADMVSFEVAGGERSSISLMLAGAVLVRAA